MDMKAVIMAGGEGRRLKAVTGELPKPMVPLLGKPLMERAIELLRANGITEICAALGYNPAPIIERFGDGSALGVHLAWRIEDQPLGTAGGVKNCMDFLGEEPFLVLSGDAACDFELGRLISEHSRSGAAVTMALYESRDPLRYGLVVPDAAGSVRCFIEKPPWERVVTNLVNTGIYVIEPRAMELVPAGESFDFASGLFPLLLERGEQIHGAIMPGYWCDIGTPRAYFQCCLDALDGALRLPDAPFEKPPEPRAAGGPGALGAARGLPGQGQAHAGRFGRDDGGRRGPGRRGRAPFGTLRPARLALARGRGAAYRDLRRRRGLLRGAGRRPGGDGGKTGGAGLKKRSAVPLRGGGAARFQFIFSALVSQ